MLELDNYEYQGQLGEPGHFGEVHLARNVLSGELVAIKHVDASKLEMSMAAWSEEASAMAACNHQNLVQIKHADLTPAGPALVMEFVEDGSWEGRHGGAAAPVAAVVDVGIDLCWGLHHLHGQGLVHRDIKPGNVLLRGDTGVLGDFGLTGLNGTQPRYQYVPHVPPEARTPPVQWTPTADVYALAVTLYRMLCGDDFSGYRGLDPGDPAALARWPDRDLWPDHIHKPLKRALRQATHPDPGKRPPTAAKFRDLLQRCRPLVSFHETAPGRWDGVGESEKWRVEIDNLTDGTATFVTSRDKGSGYRSVKSASLMSPSSPQEVRTSASAVMNHLACTGSPES